jgi:uncharacterized protein
VEEHGSSQGADACIRSVATYLPAWGTVRARIVGPDEDAVTMAVAAGRAALEGAAAAPGEAPGATPSEVVVVTRDFPLLEGGNAAAVLAGLGLPATVRVTEQLGGAAAALDALIARNGSTLVICVDLAPAGAAAVVVDPVDELSDGEGGPAPGAVPSRGTRLSDRSRLNRSMPVRTRTDRGDVHDYDDPRLLRDQGMGPTMAEVLAGRTAAPVAVAGVGARDARTLAGGAAPELPTLGASAPLFALAALVESATSGTLVALDQASASTVEVSTRPENATGRPTTVLRDERPPRSLPTRVESSPADIKIALAAYDRAFPAKLGLAAGCCPTCGTLSYPVRYRCLGCGSEHPTHLTPLRALPRQATVYSTVTVHVPVPGLATPYSLALVDLGDSGVRTLVHVTDADPGAAQIGDRGTMVLRRVAVRAGVPDYGFAFQPAFQPEPGRGDSPEMVEVRT